MSRLRIVHVSNEAFGLETANGVQHVVHCLARAQADLGHTVVVFSRDDAGANVLGPDAASPAPGAVKAPAAAHARRSVRDRLLSRYFEPTLARAVLDWHPDVVHFHSVHIPQNVTLGAQLCRAGIPYCVTVHGALFGAALQRGRIKKAAFHLAFERRYLNEARFIHAVSSQEVEPIRAAGVARPVIVIPNGLPADSEIPADQPELLRTQWPVLRGRRVFMFVGRLDTWQKGLDLLVDAFARNRLADTALVVVGPDWRGSRNQLERQARERGIRGDVVFLEPVFGIARANVLAAADVFVHTSRWEGLSLSVLSAAAARKPCLLTRAADPLGALERAHAAVMVHPDVSSISDGLRRAAALEPAELERMGNAARQAVAQEFQWPGIASRLVAAYRGERESPPTHAET